MEIPNWFLYILISFLFLGFNGFTSHASTLSDESKRPNITFSWLNDTNTFQVGDVAVIKISVLEGFDKGNASFNPVISVNNKEGNSSIISGAIVDTYGDDDINNWRISFTPIRVGVFVVVIVDHNFKLFDSSLHFNVTSGKIYPSVCIVSWMGVLPEFEAGSKVSAYIVPRDAFGNNVSISEDLTPYNFSLSLVYQNRSLANYPNIASLRWNEFGYITIEFIAAKAGSLLLEVKGGNESLYGSPLPVKVNPGPLDVSSCQAKWKIETNFWQLFSKMEIFIHQQDHYGNLVSGLYDFDADVFDKETNLSLPIADMRFERISPGIQLLSFSLQEHGDFLLVISNLKHNRSISNMPLAYTVFVGYCDGSTSVVNGSGLNDSVAGEIAEFSVYLFDSFRYSSFVDIEIIQVQIVMENDSLYLQPSIQPIINGSGLSRELSFSSISETEMAPAPSPASSKNSTGLSKVVSNAFSVKYKPVKSGIYEISVFVGNILLHGGQPFKKEVRAGPVDVSLSKVVNPDAKVIKAVENEIVVQLMDAFSNPVQSQESRLNVELASSSKSNFSFQDFVDNKDGSYTCRYWSTATDADTYKMCVSFDGKNLTTCPFSISFYEGGYFPKANEDKIEVWEDESIAFDVLKNDQFADNNANIIEFSKPERGSLLRYGNLFRYTPYQDFYGNDSFNYTLKDVNGNKASAIVNISIVNIPPQFLSFPTLLSATEDMISPRNGGFSGFEIKYSGTTEKISVSFIADHGTLFLSPMLVQFWQPMWEEFSVTKVDGKEKRLTLQGSVEVINLALESIQYLGDKNFSGGDIVRVSASNMNGRTAVEIPAFVEPINDPPFINAPKFIILNDDDTLIFDRSRDKFEFSIGDPDVINFPGGESSFTVIFSVEVDDGFLMTSMPAKLIGTTELKEMSTNQWKPLQTYVLISEHFTVKANGIRFRGTINDSNLVMEQLTYQGGDSAALTVRVNDMGHYGCDLDCTEKISEPLHAEATVILIRRSPMSSLAAHSLGSAVLLEFLVVLTLAIILLFFTCKCAIHLANERRSRKLPNSQQFGALYDQNKYSNTETFCGSYFSRLLKLPSQLANFCQRFRHRFGVQEIR